MPDRDEKPEPIQLPPNPDVPKVETVDGETLNTLLGVHRQEEDE